MKTLHFSIFINAPREKVWKTMLEKETYQQWTKAFEPTSTYEGGWEQGSEMRFISTEQNSGMFSKIKESRLGEFISIEHLGMIKDGVVDTTSDEVKKWTPAFENYTFNEKDGGTELIIDVDVADEYEETFSDMWPKALQSLKEIAEK